MGMRMLVTITIPDTEERTVALVEDLATLLRKYPGVKMKTATRQRSVVAGKRSVAAAGKKEAGSQVPSFSRLVSVSGGGRGAATTPKKKGPDARLGAKVATSNGTGDAVIKIEGGLPIMPRCENLIMPAIVGRESNGQLAPPQTETPTPKMTNSFNSNQGSSTILQD